MQTEKVIDHIVNWLKTYATNANIQGFVVGISGGIDSATTSSLCAKTGLRVLCVEMPIHQPPSHVTRAQEHIAQLKKRFANVSDVRVDLTETFETFKTALPAAETDTNPGLELSLANTRARLRMSTLYYFAGLHGYLVAGTGNKVEDFGVGFYTKYGDGGVDISPIADCSKSEVWELGKELNILNEIIEADPTDGLWDDGRTDEGQLGLSYKELEEAMNNESSVNREKYLKLRKENLHKMQAIPVCKIPR